jgi:hypothetical protein
MLWVVKGIIKKTVKLVLFLFLAKRVLVMISLPGFYAICVSFHSCFLSDLLLPPPIFSIFNLQHIATIITSGMGLAGEIGCRTR